MTNTANGLVRLKPVPYNVYLAAHRLLAKSWTDPDAPTLGALYALLDWEWGTA